MEIKKIVRRLWMEYLLVWLLSLGIVVLYETGVIQGEVETPKVKYCINRDNWRLAQELFGEFFCECARKKESCCG